MGASIQLALIRWWENVEDSQVAPVKFNLPQWSCTLVSTVHLCWKDNFIMVYMASASLKYAWRYLKVRPLCNACGYVPQHALLTILFSFTSFMLNIHGNKIPTHEDSCSYWHYNIQRKWGENLIYLFFYSTDKKNIKKGQPSIESSVWSIRNTLLTRYSDGQSSLTCSFQAKSKWVLSKSTASPEVKWPVQKNKQWLDYIVLSLSWIPDWVAGFVGNCCMCIWISFFFVCLVFCRHCIS